jgi:hypothetical protein
LASQSRLDPLEHGLRNLAAPVVLIEQGQRVPGCFWRAPREHLNGAQEGILIARAARESVKPNPADVEVIFAAAVVDGGIGRHEGERNTSVRTGGTP